MDADEWDSDLGSVGVKERVREWARAIEIESMRSKASDREQIVVNFYSAITDTNG